MAKVKADPNAWVVTSSRTVCGKRAGDTLTPADLAAWGASPAALIAGGHIRPAAKTPVTPDPSEPASPADTQEE